MGRWAQARRRASTLPTGGGLGPPPAPVASWVNDGVFATATGADDTGGTFAAYVRYDGDPVWYFVTDVEWAASREVVGSGEVIEGDYIVREVGNGVAYVGESADSNAITWPV